MLIVAYQISLEALAHLGHNMMKNVHFKMFYFKMFTLEYACPPVFDLTWCYTIGNIMLILW